MANTLLVDRELLDPALLDHEEPSSAIRRYRKALQHAHQVLFSRFRKGEDIHALLKARAAVVDHILRHAWCSLQLHQEPLVGLLAVGGYGRAELHPHSDIDVLVLHDLPGLNTDMEDRISRFITLLWDLGLDVGSSVRSILECASAARDDITIATNLMESRTLIGHESLRQRMLDTTSAQHLWTGKDFYAAKLAEQKERHAKHNNTEYNLEPDIKNAPGGLRDIQMVGWVVKRHYHATTLHDLVEHNFLTEQEYMQLDACQTLLWRIRFALHCIAGRAENKLLFDYQRQVAEMLGMQDEPRQRAVEQLMKQYYRSAMLISTLNEMLLQHFDENILGEDDRTAIEPVNNRFQIRNHHVEVTHPSIFRRYPSALLEIFVLVCNSPQVRGIRASTIRLIMQNVDLIDAGFRQDLRHTSLFIELLRSPHALFRTLRSMKRYGVLGRYIPAFGAIMGQMQFDLFHIYTVDAHTLLLIKNMRRFRYPDVQDRFPVVAQVALNLPKIELLYLAGLFHDIAKGRGGDHSELGATDAFEFCIQHRLSNWDAHLVAWLTRNHLSMSMTAQKKDINDPDVINEFAIKVGDTVHLDYLYALTVADICATNPTLWNSWRASLLRQLYQQTHRALRRGLGNPIDKSEWIEETRLTALASLSSVGVDEQAVTDLWNNLGDEYFLRETANDITWHTQAILQHGHCGEPLVLIRETTQNRFLGATQIFVYTNDQPNLFAATVAALDQLHLNVLDARIMTSASRFSLDTYIVLDENNERLTDMTRLRNIQQALTQTLAQPDQFPDIVKRRMPRQLRHFKVKTEVLLSNDIVHQITVVEVVTLDRPGLLARIGKIFMEHGVNLRTARIATLGERADDVFFLTDRMMHPISDPALCTRLAETLKQQLDQDF